MKINQLKFNPTDLDSMINIMDTYGDNEKMLFGDNENGESVTLSIFKDKIIVETYQCNGRVRENIYWRDGTTEESFIREEEPYEV